MRISFFHPLSMVAIIASFVVASCNSRPSEPTHETFAELRDPTADTLSDWSGVSPGLHYSFVTIDQRFHKSVAPAVNVEDRHRVEGWKGERVSAQLLLWSNAEVENVNIDFSEFNNSESEKALSSSIAQARFVRYVMTDEFGGGCGPRQPEDYAASLSPDMLDNLASFDIAGESTRPVWITVDIPRSADAGIYTSTMQVTAAGQPTIQLDLELEVIDQLLPQPSEWGFHLDQWQHPSAVARVADVELWSDEHFEAMRPTMQLLADAGQKVITATLNKDPWNVQTFDPYDDMIQWTKHGENDWSYDYSIFDRWVEFMMDLGVTKMINCYSIIPWNNEIHYYDEARGQTVNVEAKPGTPIFEAMWKPFLTDFSAHLRTKGWLEITNIAMDERDPESMDAAFQLINAVAPELGVSFADNHKTYQRYPNSKDISVSIQDPFDKQDLIDRQKRGLITTFYVCCTDPFPNQFTFSDPAESTYLAWFAKAWGFDGLLRWAFNSWVEKPMLDSRFRTWPAGDTYIVYPGGRSSIRYERMLEGIQDFEKHSIITDLLTKSGKEESLVELNQAVNKLKSAQRTSSWNEDLNEAKAILNTLSKTIQQ